MRIYLCLFALLFGLGLLSQQTIIASSDSFTQIIRERYSLSYPQSWEVDTSKTFGMDLLLRSPKVDSLDQFMENINVFVQDLKGQNYDLSKMGQESETQIKNLVTDAEIIESRLDSTAASFYYSLKYKGRQGKFFLTTEQRYYLKNEVGFAVTFTLQNGKEKEYRLLADKIFNSFNLP